MSVPWLAELPLKAPEAGVLRLMPGQLLRARVIQVQGPQATLDLGGYATLPVRLSSGSALTVGQRVLVQVQDVGPQRLALALLPAAAPSPALPGLPPAAELLRSLGLPGNDPLLLIAQQLQPQAGQMPSPVLAALVLAFGESAPGLLSPVARMLQQRGKVTAAPTDAAALRQSAQQSLGLLDAIEALLTGRTSADPATTATVTGRWSQAADDPAALLSLALSALAGRPVRYFQEAGGGWALVAEEEGGSGTGQVWRFAARLDLPRLGQAGITCLLAPAAVIGRCTVAAAHVPRVEEEIKAASSALRSRLGRPVHCTVQAGSVADPLAAWCAGQPWLARGEADVHLPGEWVDRKA